MKVFLYGLAMAILFVAVNFVSAAPDTKSPEYIKFDKDVLELLKLKKQGDEFRDDCILLSSGCQCKLRDDIKRYADQESCKYANLEATGLLPEFQDRYSRARLYQNVIDNVFDHDTNDDTDYNFNKRYNDLKLVIDNLPATCMPDAEGCLCIDPTIGPVNKNVTECTKRS